MSENRLFLSGEENEKPEFSTQIFIPGASTRKCVQVCQISSS